MVRSTKQRAWKAKRAFESFLNDRLRKLGYEIRGQRTLRPAFVPNEFWEINDRISSLSLLPWEALYDTYRAVRYVVQSQVPGALVECGVWRGGCSILMGETLTALGESDRQIYMYDTFTGMPDGGAEDASITTGEMASGKRQRKGGKWVAVSLEEVSANVAQSSYPLPNFKLIQGLVEDTIPARSPAEIAVLRLDTDMYSSTKHELNHLFPLLAPGGVLIVDDYGAWSGSRQALEEYVEENDVGLFLTQNPIHGSVTAVKHR